MMTGYGDLSPSSSASRAFTVCFALYGIIILGIFLGVVGEFIIQRHEETMRKRLSNARIRILQNLGTDDTTIPPQQRSLMKLIMGILLAETPVLVGLVMLGAPIILLENWDMDKG
jgi:Ion channel